MDMFSDVSSNEDGIFGGVDYLFDEEDQFQPIWNGFLMQELPFDGYFFSYIDCPICFEKTDEVESLSCGDVYCGSCVKLLIKNYIDNGEVYPEQIVCPICQESIQDSDITRILGDFQYTRVINFREKFHSDRLVATGRAKYCPIQACEGIIHVINGVNSLTCALCRATVCENCGKCSHPLMTCEEYSKSIGDDYEEELLMSRDLKRCPYCQYFIDRADNGCNFLKCQSSVCKPYDRAVCYICGKGLNEKHHFTHYVKSGPFSNSCNTLDGIEDYPVDPMNVLDGPPPSLKGALKRARKEFKQKIEDQNDTRK